MSVTTTTLPLSLPLIITCQALYTLHIAPVNPHVRYVISSIIIPALTVQETWGGGGVSEDKQVTQGGKARLELGPMWSSKSVLLALYHTVLSICPCFCTGHSFSSGWVCFICEQLSLLEKVMRYPSTSLFTKNLSESYKTSVDLEISYYIKWVWGQFFFSFFFF